MQGILHNNKIPSFNLLEPCNMHTFLITLAVIAFFMIVLEDVIHLNKAKTTLFLGTLAWLVLFLFPEPNLSPKDIQEMLNEKGIKSQIIKTYVPILNELIKKYLAVLEFNVEFSFNEAFEETIKMEGRTDVVYYSLSEGQKMRIDLCLLFAFRDISRMKNSTSTNLLIFDEIGDSSLDEEGFSAFLRIIKDSAKNGSNVFIISHNEELQTTDALDRTLEVKMVNNFTEMTEN